MTAVAIRRAGGRAIRITPAQPRRSLVASLDALVVGGGADVSPRLYGDELTPPLPRSPRERPLWRHLLSVAIAGLMYLLRRIFSLPRHTGIDRARDELELGLLKEAHQRGWPVLGICRGAQLMNVFGRGTLHQKITEYVEAPMWTVRPIKSIRVAAGTQLRQLIGETCIVNSLHRQSIARVAAHFRVAARDHKEVVQAIESADGRWLGVQWHPEYMPQRPEQQQLFAHLIAEVKA